MKKAVSISRLQASKSDLAAFFGVSLQTVSAWIRAGLPCKRRRSRLTFDLKAAFDWWRARNTKTAGDTAATEQLARWRTARATKEEFELARMAADYLPADYIEARILPIARRLSDRLTRIGTVHGRAVARDIDQAVHAHLAELEEAAHEKVETD